MHRIYSYIMILRRVLDSDWDNLSIVYGLIPSLDNFRAGFSLGCPFFTLRYSILDSVQSSKQCGNKCCLIIKEKEQRLYSIGATYRRSPGLNNLEWHFIFYEDGNNEVDDVADVIITMNPILIDSPLIWLIIKCVMLWRRLSPAMKSNNFMCRAISPSDAS